MPPPNQSSYLPPPAEFPVTFDCQFYTPSEAPQLAQYGYNGVLPQEDAYMYSGLNSNHLLSNSPIHLDLQGSTALSALSDATGPVVNANRKWAADSSAAKPKRTRKRARRGDAAVLSASEHPLVDPSSSRMTVAGPSVPTPPSAPIRPAPMLHFGLINHAIRST
ncbi:hypothetical protein C8Q74DRAFT_1363567 [Fomes fomentarius]|nr:hypothetical protein C8Q74DRAFT_1363567 [Fomes fomentarius]